MTLAFDAACRRCDRLARFLEQVKAEHPGYFCQPVPPFGAANPGLLVVGLAPGLHGANASGRPFTGDHAGILLYQTLHRFGFASAPASLSADDSLELIDCRITNAVKCLPPQNKPVGAEINACRDYLAVELQTLRPASVVVALGSIAHKSVVAAFGLRQKDCVFAHAAEHTMPREVILIDSYHCSRYNTQTRRLTTPMFEDVFARARARLAAVDAEPSQ
jgi:uracil-DNA glycosylase family 4